LITALIESYKQGAERPFEVINEIDPFNPAGLERRIEDLEQANKYGKSLKC